MADQAVRLVKGRRAAPLSMSCIDARLMTESWASFVKVQNWRASSSHGAAFRLAKSEGRMADLDTCLTEA